jgi:hypothetical protein
MHLLQVSEPLINCSIGTDLDGQIGALYLYSRAEDPALATALLQSCTVQARSSSSSSSASSSSASTDSDTAASTACADLSAAAAAAAEQNNSSSSVRATAAKLRSVIRSAARQSVQARQQIRCQFAAAWLPARCSSSTNGSSSSSSSTLCWDVHSGLHGHLCGGAHVWTGRGRRGTAISSIGGISALLPLFQR